MNYTVWQAITHHLLLFVFLALDNWHKCMIDSIKDVCVGKPWHSTQHYIFAQSDCSKLWSSIELWPQKVVIAINPGYCLRPGKGQNADRSWLVGDEYEWWGWGAELCKKRRREREWGRLENWPTPPRPNVILVSKNNFSKYCQPWSLLSLPFSLRQVLLVVWATYELWSCRALIWDILKLSISETCRCLLLFTPTVNPPIFIMDRFHSINPFTKKESHSKNEIIAYKVLTILSWLLLVISSFCMLYQTPVIRWMY